MLVANGPIGLRSLLIAISSYHVTTWWAEKSCAIKSSTKKFDRMIAGFHKENSLWISGTTRFCAAIVFKSAFKVFRYSFFGTIPNFLNRLLDSLFLVRSTWNLQYLLVLDWTLAWFTFCKNRYFHHNDKQKSSKTVKLKFCTIQISLRKANTSIINCGVRQTKYTKTKKFCLFVLK